MLVIECSVCGCDFVYRNGEDEDPRPKPAAIKFVGNEEAAGPSVDSGSVPAPETQSLIYLRCPNGHLRPYRAYTAEKSVTSKKGPFGIFRRKEKIRYITNIVPIPLPAVQIDNSKADSNNIVDDYFWLEDMRTCMKDVWTIQRNAADKLSTFVTWLWSGYTTLFAASAFAFLDVISEMPFTFKALLTAPVILLPFAYYLCVRAQMPHEESILDYRMPESIETSNINLLLRKSKSYKHAGGATFLSIIAFVAAVLSFSYFQSTRNRIEAVWNDDRSVIIVTADVPANTVMKISVDSWRKNGAGKRDTSLSYINPGKGASGLYFPVKDSSAEYSVLAFWKEKEKEMSYAQVLKK